MDSEFRTVGIKMLRKLQGQIEGYDNLKAVTKVKMD